LDVDVLTATHQFHRDRYVSWIANDGVSDGEVPENCKNFRRLNGKLRRKFAGPVLREAGYRGDVELYRRVMDKCPKLKLACANNRGNLGESSVHAAAAMGSARILKQFLERSPNMNALDIRGETPLHYAAFAGRADTVALLLEFRADAKAENFNSETPLQVAMQQPAYFLPDVKYNDVIDALRKGEEDQEEWSERDEDGIACEEGTLPDQDLGDVLEDVPEHIAHRLSRVSSNKSSRGCARQASDAAQEEINKLRLEVNELKWALSEAVSQARDLATGATTSTPRSQPLAGELLSQNVQDVFSNFGVEYLSPVLMRTFLSNYVSKQESETLVNAICRALHCHPETGRISVTELIEWLRRE